MTNVNRNIQFLGIIGLIFLIFGLLVRALVAVDDFNLAAIHFGLAFILLIAFAVRGGLHVLGSAASRRTAGFGAGVTAYALLFLGLLGVANYYVAKHELFKYDSTNEKIFTLDTQTQRTLSSLQKPIRVRAFYVGKIDSEAEGLLNRYKQFSDKFRWEFVDAEKRQNLVEQFGISTAPTLHISYDEPGIESSQSTKVVKTITEQELTNAILKLTRGGEKVIYSLTGHGEGDLDSQSEEGYQFLKEGIEGQNLRVEKLLLDQAAKVPDDASALLIISPKKPLLGNEIAAIKQYLANGGNGVFLTDPKTTDDIASVVKPLGIEVGKDIVVDQVVQLFSGPTLGLQPMVNTYANHPVTKDLEGATVFNAACSVIKGKDAKDGEVLELAMTGKNSWAEKNIDKIFSDDPQASLDPDDIRGPVSIAVAFEGAYPQPQPAAENQTPAQPKKSKIVVFGDSDFVSNINIRNLYNGELLYNAINWAVSQGEGVTIASRKWSRSIKVISQEQFSQIFVFSAIIFPELLLAGGLAVWWFRKR